MFVLTLVFAFKMNGLLSQLEAARKAHAEQMRAGSSMSETQVFFNIFLMLIALAYEHASSHKHKHNTNARTHV